MARELRKAAKDSGEDVAAHRGLVKMIPPWNEATAPPGEQYRLLYLKVFRDALGGLSQGMALGTGVAVRLGQGRPGGAAASPCTLGLQRH